MSDILYSILEIIALLINSIVSTLGGLSFIIDKLFTNVGILTSTTLGLIIAILILGIVLFLLGKFVMGNVRYLIILFIIGVVLLTVIYLIYP